MLRVQAAYAEVQRALQLLDDPRELARMCEAAEYWVSKHAGAVQLVMGSYRPIRLAGTSAAGQID